MQLVLSRFTAGEPNPLPACFVCDSYKNNQQLLNNEYQDVGDYTYQYQVLTT